MLSKYNFTDISVFAKIKDTKYLNLTAFDMKEQNEILDFRSDSEYVIMFHSFAYSRYADSKQVYICDITLDELLMLSGINDNRFIDRMEKDKDILAVMYARCILDYNFGKAIKKEGTETVYDFYRRIYIKKEDGKAHRQRGFVLSKVFYKGI